MTLHVPTLIIVLLLVQAMSALVLGMLWWRDRTSPGLGEWALGRLFVLLALLILSARDVLSMPLSILVGQGFLLLGVHVAWLGTLTFMGRERPASSLPALLFSLAYLGAISILVVLHTSFPLRAALSSSMMGGYTLLIARAFWPLWRDPAYLLGKLLVGSFLFTGLFHLARVPYFLLAHPNGALLDDSEHAQILFLASILSTLVTGFGCVGVTIERLNGRLRHLAERDPLTGLRNRRDFFVRAGEILDRVRREDLPLGVLALDLDHFKGVNDTHGHAVGDRALCHVATLLRESRGEDGLLARMGGEEFALLLPGLTEPEARALAETICARIAGTPLSLGDAVNTASPRDAVNTTLPLTASIGMVQTRGRDLSDRGPVLDHLLQAADQALYLAKADGRNRVVQGSITYPAPGPGHDPRP
ncbi:GGDEF domain-containing protein [Rhodospirillum sp. A1_3_36]|uniref:GGDEF domain-containing protein n=1 Tax=Rhodospirillum sp. A1_3_36 TaxID=3391666 RepID=UPI0039A421FA